MRRNTMVRTVLAALLLAALTGCNTAPRNQDRVAESRTVTLWKEDSTLARRVVAGNTKLVGDTVQFDLTERYGERQYTAIEEIHETRRVRSGDMFFAVATLGMGCLKLSECIGSTSEWERSQPQRFNTTATSVTRTRERPNTMGGTVSVTWTAFSADGRQLGTKAGQIGLTETAKVPLRPFAESLPAHPDRIEVSLALDSKQPSKVRVELPELKRLNLKAEAWLPVAERETLYSAQLRERLLARDWAGANLVFAKLEALGTPLPGAFSYRYGQSLLRAGSADKGKSYLRRYLEQAGRDGEFVAEANKLLASQGGK